MHGSLENVSVFADLASAMPAWFFCKPLITNDWVCFACTIPEHV
jgi:hypothetical protein